MSEFSSVMTGASLHFYRRVLGKAILNLYAVRMGFFDTLLCETDDPRIDRRWEEAVPKIVAAMRQGAWRDGETDEDFQN